MSGDPVHLKRSVLAIDTCWKTDAMDGADFGIAYQKVGGTDTPAHHRVADELEREGEAALTYLLNQNQKPTGSAVVSSVNGTSDDDEFSYDAEVQPHGEVTAAKPAVGAIVSEGEGAASEGGTALLVNPVDALAAIRQAFAPAEEPTATASTTPSDPAAAAAAPGPAMLGPGQKLGVVVEEGDDDEGAEDDDDDEEGEGEPSNVAKPGSAASAEASVSAAASSPSAISGAEAAAAPDSAKDGAGAAPAAVEQLTPEEAALADEFEQATAAHLNAAAEAAKAAAAGPVEVPSVAFADAYRHLTERSAVEAVRPTIVAVAPDPSQSCWAHFFAAQLHGALHYERDVLFCIAKMAYSPHNSIHNKLMRCLYARLAGSNAQTSTSVNWQVIGFQREADFSTDLRGCGMLGPLQMLYVTERYPWLASLGMSVATAPLNPFPLMVQAIQLTAKMLQALRQGKLTVCCNDAHKVQRGAGDAKEGQVGAVTTVAHDFFSGLLFDFLTRWQQQKCGIDKIGHVTLAAVSWASSNPKTAIAALHERDTQQRGE